MDTFMKKIEILKITKCENSQYIQPKTIHYIQNNVKKSWDIVDAHDSVAILIYHKTKQSFVLVRQFRPSIFLKNQNGWTYELCAGLMDKEGKSPEVVASEEVLEETGYQVKPSSLEKISSFYTAVGFAGSKQSLYFVSVDDSLKVNAGGGIDNEYIEVIYVPKQEAKDFIFNENIPRTSGLMFALSWFFNYKKL